MYAPSPPARVHSGRSQYHPPEQQPPSMHLVSNPLLRNLLLRLAALFLCSFPAYGTVEAWETVRHNGHDYVTVRSIKNFYGFQSMRVSGKFLELENKVVKIQFTLGGQEVFMNKVKFVFSFKVIPHKGRYLVSRVDLAKLVEPVLRPSYIRNSAPFDTVIVDPGHGGNDPGAVNSQGLEKDYNLAVARIVKERLEARRFKVVMTRNSDRALSLTERVELANRYQNAIFISIHFNSGGRRRAQGIETFTLSPAGVAHYGRGVRKDDFELLKGNSQDSANIALATAVHSTCLLKTRRPDRGIRRARFSVLTGVRPPAILLEGGFMDNPYEAKLIADLTYQRTLATAITEAIWKYRQAIYR